VMSGGPVHTGEFAGNAVSMENGINGGGYFCCIEAPTEKIV